MTPAALRVLAFLRANPGGHDLRAIARAVGSWQAVTDSVLWELTGLGEAREMLRVVGEGVEWLRLWRAA